MSDTEDKLTPILEFDDAGRLTVLNGVKVPPGTILSQANSAPYVSSVPSEEYAWTVNAAYDYGDKLRGGAGPSFSIGMAGDPSVTVSVPGMVSTPSDAPTAPVAPAVRMPGLANLFVRFFR